MKYKSFRVNEDGTRVTNRNSRKSERAKVFIYNKRLASLLRKERKQARLEAAEAEQSAEVTE